MTTIPLDAMVRLASQVAERLFDEEGVVDMFWLVDTPAGLTHVLSPVFAENPTQGRQVKDVINEAMREFLREHDATRFVRVAEVWTLQEVPSTSPKATMEWRAKGSGTLEDHPPRKEQIFLMASDGREVLISSRDIIRPPGGKPYLSKLSEIERPKELRGAWVRCLPGTSRSSSGAS